MRIEESKLLVGRGRRAKRIQYFHKDPEEELKPFLDEVVKQNSYYIDEKERKRVFTITELKSTFRKDKRFCVSGISEDRYDELIGTNADIKRDSLVFVPPYKMAGYIDRDDIYEIYNGIGLYEVNESGYRKIGTISRDGKGELMLSSASYRAAIKLFTSLKLI